MRDAVLPVILIVVGVLWLLMSLGWVPDFNWVVFGVLQAAGIAILVIDGITKRTVITAPFLMVMGIAWFAHFEYNARVSRLAPTLMIVMGVLLLVARIPAIPERRLAARKPLLTVEPPQ